MEWIPFVLLFLIGGPIVLAIWLISRAHSASRQIEELSNRVKMLEIRLDASRAERAHPAPAHAAAQTATPPHAPTAPAFTPPPQPAPQPAAPPPISRPAPVPPTLPPPPLTPRPVRVPEPALSSQEDFFSAIDWEKFMGVRLFAWIGGLALFIGVALAIKYSFDHNLIRPELRMAMGFLTGLGVLIGGVILSRRNYPALSQTLCATGILILYAVTFACRSFYHFAFFSPLVAFALMALITAAAFVLAARLNALVVAILGMLGGFLTPILLSTGQDNPLGLFGYIAILDAGLILVAVNRRWFFLTALAAGGTLLMQVGWVEKFFVAGRYFEENQILVPMAVLLGFAALYLAGAFWARRRDPADGWTSGSAFALSAAALAFSAWFLSFEPLAHRPALMFAFVFLIDLLVVGLSRGDSRTTPAFSVFGLGVFGLLAYWTTRFLNPGMLTPALAFYFLFAVIHSILPFLWRKQAAPAGLWGSQVFPPLALALVLVPILKLADVSFLVWPFVLLVDLLAIGLAVLSASLLSVMAVLVLTLAATGLLIFRVPDTLAGLPLSFSLLAVFSVLFVGASVWLARRFKRAIQAASEEGASPAIAMQLPVFSSVLPFALLIMAAVKLPLANPSPLFGLGLLLTVLMLAVALLFDWSWLPLLCLACVAGVESAWHFHHFDPALAGVPLAWYLGFLAVFSVFPFVFLRRLSKSSFPWVAAALAELPQFLLVHRLVAAAWPNSMMGLLPAAFALPPLLSLAMVLKKISSESPARMNQLAWFGGVALFFITLIFPIQFERQWITIGWALEGAALLWLFHRVPHRGLQLAGTLLLVIAFARLALNQAVLAYHPRSEIPLLNWYLYAYGIVTVCLFVAGRLTAAPRNRILEVNAPALFNALGTILAFLLVNIEIADFFSAPGSTLTFEFSGSFARDMTYSIAWALFALGLLLAGILRKLPASRYAALALLSVTILKLFFHDLSQLEQLYRIGAFIGVAVIAMLASFAYQRFFTATAKEKTQDAKDPS